MRQWYFTRQGQTKGPYTTEQLRKLASSGQVLPEDLVSHTGASKWVAAREVPDLFPAAGAPPVSAPAAAAATAPPPARRRSFLEALLGLPKPLLFGIFGGIGGLLGALLLGELLWALLSPAGYRPPPPQVRLGVPASLPIYPGGKNHFVIKIAREGFKGPVRIEAEKPPPGVSIAPATVPDDSDEAEVEIEAARDLEPGPRSLTVWGRGPSGKNVQDSSGSVELSVHTPEVRMGLPPFVRVYLGGKNRFVVKIVRDGFKGPVRFEAETLPRGISLAPVTVPPDSDEAEVEVEAARDLEPGPRTLNLWCRAPSASHVPDSPGIVKLNVEPVPAQLRLSVPTEVGVFQGGKTQFRIKLARYHFEGPVKLHFEGLPEAVALADATVGANSSEEEFTVQAPESSKVGEWTVTVLGTRATGQGRTTARFNLRVRPRPIPQADIVFVLDLTASMQFAIDGVKLGIQNFASQLEASRINARIALVGFRDIEGDRERPFVMVVDGKPFTKDFQAFRQEVSKLRALNFGNDDIPESSLQGLALAAAQPFRANASSVLILITDAPPKYHPKEKPATVAETLEELSHKKLKQFHLVVREEDYRAVYKQFHGSFKGSFHDLTRIGNSSNAFSDILPKLSREISTLTIAAQPRTPGDVPALPALPVESALAPPSPAAEAVRPAAPLPPPPVVAAVVKAVQSTQAYTRQDRHQLLVAIAVWTMAVAGCISLLILAGQRFYACRRFVGLLEAGKGMGGGFLAGLVGGAAGQLLFQNTAGGTTWVVASRLLGWGLLGGLIGAGMSLCVPNLKWWRGLVGGLVGGVVGAMAFVLVSFAVGSFLGRWIGAGILGFFIGLMVALAELAFRRYWLEIRFGQHEVRTVTLGSAEVSLGGDERRVAIAVPGSPPIALRYRIEGDRVICQDVIKERTGELLPGDCKTLGKVTITLCSAAHGRKVGCTLQLSNGASFHLVEGLPLTGEDLPGLQAQGADGVVALVGSRPNDPRTLLLRNRSKQTWVLRRQDGGQQAIEPGRGLELSSNGAISFGQIQGTLRHDAR